MNNVQIIGTMTKDCEIKYLPSGSAIGGFGIAYNERYKKQDGTPVEKAHFFDVTVIGKKAETLSNYFKKGSRIGITGSLDFQSWKDQQDNNRSKVCIKLNDFTFIDKKSDNQSNYNENRGNGAPQQNAYNNGVPNENYDPNPKQGMKQQQYQNVPTIDIDEDEIPF